MGPKAIAAIVEKIAGSSLPVAEYFRRHAVPFSRAQYFRYKERLQRSGVEGLLDGRRHGNHRTLNSEAQALIRGAHAANPQWGLAKLADQLRHSLDIEVDPSTVSRFLRSAGLLIQRTRASAEEVLESVCGGIEILGALALHLDWGRHTAELIVRERERFCTTEAFRNERMGRDGRGRNAQGRFTAAYNRRTDIREQRFASLEDKRGRKNYSRMKLFQSSQRVLQRKCLGVLALPLITLNGQSRTANNPLGNALEHFCGYNYQHHTLDKFLRELKYLGLAERLLKDQVSFWRESWREFHDEVPPLLCYYVDGSTKALWSSKHVKQNKVTMLGRIMGCLEQVFVHDTFGHPVYLETYAGKAPVGEHILGLFEKIEAALEGPGPALKAQRVIVMDAASNGVGTLRAFARQDKYHYITALDDNQWNPRKVLQEGRAKRYYFGKATLHECRLELEDSKEKGFLVEVRAIRIEWDHGKRTVLITSLPIETVGASEVVKAYFDRWPCEELQFRGMKSFACLNRVAGYGKKKLTDEKVCATQKKLASKIASLRQKLKSPLKRIADQEELLAVLIEQARGIRCQGQIVNGRRKLKAGAQRALEPLLKDITAADRQIKALQAPYKKDFKTLRRCEKKWLRLQGKDQVYRIDVELDQIMGFFRIALVNLASFFLTKCFDRQPMSLTRLLHAILMMPAEIRLTDSVRCVILKRNLKDPQMMTLLESALRRLTDLNIHDWDERKFEFQLA